MCLDEETHVVPWRRSLHAGQFTLFLVVQGLANILISFWLNPGSRELNGVLATVAGRGVLFTSEIVWQGYSTLLLLRMVRQANYAGFWAAFAALERCNEGWTARRESTRHV